MQVEAAILMHAHKHTRCSHYKMSRKETGGVLGRRRIVSSFWRMLHTMRQGKQAST